MGRFLVARSVSNAASVSIFFSLNIFLLNQMICVEAGPQIQRPLKAQVGLWRILNVERRFGVGQDSSLAATLWSSAELGTLVVAGHFWGSIATWPSSTMVTSTLCSNLPFTWQGIQHLINWSPKCEICAAFMIRKSVFPTFSSSSWNSKS